MKITKFTMIAMAIMLLAASAALAQERRLTSEGDGYSFAVPKGWASEANGEGFALVDPAKAILIAVKGHAYRDIAAFMADANFQRDGLELVGKPQEIAGGTTFRTVKRTPQGMVVIDTSVLFSQTGNGVMVVAMTDEAHANAGFDAGLAVAAGVRFEAVKATATAGRVNSVLSGKVLTYLYTGNGYSERKDIVLCASGTFYQSTDMGGFSPGDADGPSFAATGGKSGSWSIGANGSRLILRFRGGSTSEYNISARQASNEIGLNGQRFFVQPQNFCR